MSKPYTKIEESSRFYFGPPPSQPVPTAPVYTTPPDAWVLGEGYHLNDEGKVRLSQHAQSFLRWSYRRDFPALLPYSITSDSGWGCMIRAAQMMMSTALLRHYLGKGKYTCFVSYLFSIALSIMMDSTECVCLCVE